MSGSSDRRPTSCWKAQSAQMPPEEATPLPLASGARALLEVTRRGFARLEALPAPVFAAVARRLAERFPHDASTPGTMATWPDDVRALAVPLYELGLLVHCLPYYGSWLWEPLTAESDLSATLPTARFAALAREALAEAGTPTAGVGAHSLRRGGAAELAHGGMNGGMLLQALRHLSERSTIPYVFQSVHTSVLAGAMRAAARRSRGCGLRGAAGGRPVDFGHRSPRRRGGRAPGPGGAAPP